MTSFSSLAHISSKYNDIGSSSGLILGLRFLLLGFGEGSKTSTSLEPVSLSLVLLFVLFLYNGHPFLLFKSEDNKIAANFGLKFFISACKVRKYMVVGVSRPRGSLDRRVNCRRVPQPRWVGARRSAKGGGSRRETGVRGGIPRPSCLSRAQVGCACSRGLQASTREGASGLTRAPSRPSPRGQPSVRGPWIFLL
jgi:hypothetical protein